MDSDRNRVPEHDHVIRDVDGDGWIGDRDIADRKKRHAGKLITPEGAVWVDEEDASGSAKEGLFENSEGVSLGSAGTGDGVPDGIQRKKRQAEEAIAPAESPDDSTDEGEPGGNPEPEAPENRDGDEPEDTDGELVHKRVKRNHDDGQHGNREGESPESPEGADPVDPGEAFDDGGQRKKLQGAATPARPVNRTSLNVYICAGKTSITNVRFALVFIIF